ncbi:MAG: hypothetical protein SH848_21445 [Saprospiraceae bacterium]|nr:hypothetical protein [Saprospiraceae bacterium]
MLADPAPAMSEGQNNEPKEVFLEKLKEERRMIALQGSDWLYRMADPV